MVLSAFESEMSNSRIRVLPSVHLPSITFTNEYDERGGQRFVVGEEGKGDMETAIDIEQFDSMNRSRKTHSFTNLSELLYYVQDTCVKKLVD